jgi:choice-of-anchor C domain-containing protein
MKKTLIAGLVMLGAVGVAHADPLIQNGSFEFAAVGGSFTTLDAGSGALTGWSIDSGSIDHIGSYWTAQDGLQSLDLAGNTNGVISQSFATTANQAYNVSFWVAGNSDNGSSTKLGSVGVVGSATQSIVFDASNSTHTNMGWVQQNYSFVATGANSTLTFASTAPGGTAYGLALDNVSVAAVPEPESYAMLLAGLGLMGFVGKRRKSKQA